jgi:ribonucleoside-diphosphate reductase beta chain
MLKPNVQVSPITTTEPPQTNAHQEPKKNIFEKRVNLKPYEYPELAGYVEDIRDCYWRHQEYNYDPDVQDMRVNMEPHEVEAVNRTMMAISQIEVAVKSFWSKIGDHLPKPEIAKVGATFADSEARHEDAYSHLLEKLGLNKRFEGISTIPAMWDRIAYINKINERTRQSTDPRDYFKSIIFFSMLIENVSLFSQFYIIMSFDKHKKMLKGMSNAIEATSKEEDLHANFGFDIINIMKKEHPEWWSADLVEYIKEKMLKAYKAELKVLDWIYEHGDLETAPKIVVEEFIKHRLNKSMEAIGIEPLFDIHDNYKQFNWFEDEILVTKQNDFFQKRSTAYTKRNKAITEEDLF